MTKKITIIADHDGKNIKPITWELFAFAKKIQAHEKADIYFFIIGENTKELAQDISIHSGCKTYAMDVLGTNNYHGQIYKKILIPFLTKNPADYILVPHTTSGMDYAPALSIALKGSCITAVEGIHNKDNVLHFVRAMFGRKIQADLSNKNLGASSPQVLTLQAGSFKPFKLDQNDIKNINIIHEAFDCLEKEMIYKGCQPSPSKGSNLAKAEVIVSGGRGIEEEENYKYIEMLADIFPRSATGASRPICDYGWAKYSQQVGATGTIISPKLYIACGISGATQHLEGIRDSQFIVAINSDPDAPIFQVADICIIEDLTDFIPIIVETAKKKRPTN